MSRPSSFRRTAIGAATIAALVAFWYFGSRGGLIDPQVFPTPDQFGAAAWQLLFGGGFGDGRLHEHVLQSVKLILMGFFAASSMGVTLGLWMGWNRTAEALVNPIFLLIRPIPALAWIPLAIVWLGLGDAAKIMVIFVAAFVPSVINSYTGVRQIEKPIFEAAAMLDVSGWRYWREVLIPGAMPSIFTGLRLSLQAAWTTLVAAELIGAIAGLGQILNQAAQDIFPAMIMVGMLSVALCGWLMTLALGWIEARATPWRAR